MKSGNAVRMESGCCPIYHMMGTEVSTSVDMTN
jgi:hypothetical protein